MGLEPTTFCMAMQATFAPARVPPHPGDLLETPLERGPRQVHTAWVASARSSRRRRISASSCIEHDL
jgi:hypothetical protein